MVLKLYGYPLSTCTRYVALVLREKGVPYELVPVDLAKGEHKAASFVEKQPFGQVPYIDDDGFILYESRAIARYIVKKYPDQGTPGLIPTDLKEEAVFEQAASVEAFHYNASTSVLAFEKVFKLRRGLKTDEARVEEHLKKLEAILDVYEGILGRQKYLAGETVTLADLQHVAYGSVVFLAGHGEVFTKRPNVSRWWNDISNREAWLAVKNGA